MPSGDRERILERLEFVQRMLDQLQRTCQESSENRIVFDAVRFELRAAFCALLEGQRTTAERR